MEIDIPKSFFKKDYYADNFIEGRDKAIDELKSDSVNLKPVLNHIDKFNPINDILFTRFDESMSKVKGEIKFKPIKFSLSSSGGGFQKKLVCDVIIKNAMFFNNDDLDVFKSMPNDSIDALTSIMKDDYYGLNKVFKKVVRLFGMDDYDLSINDIKIIYDE